MRHTRFRRLCALALIVAFGLGVGLQGMLGANMAAQVTGMAMSSDEQPAGCGACDDHEGIAPSDCYQMCVGFVAVVPAEALAAMTIMTMIPLGRGVAVAGRTGPPEPYPPRTFAMA